MYLPERLNIFEYEQVLYNNGKFSCSFTGSPKDNRMAFGNIWRYAITHILKWNALQAKKYLNDDIISQLKLDRTYFAIDFDREHSYVYNYEFALQYAFPEEVKFDEYSLVIQEYERFSKQGAFANDTSDTKKPKNFFDGLDGMERACMCLRYEIDNYLSDKTVPELYAFFANEKESRKWLRKVKLSADPLKNFYETPLNYLHAALPYKSRSELHYYKYLIRNIAKEKEMLMAKEKGLI